ncbi:MAG: cyclic nucleotide-binding domain-containing protein [Magnetococcales bacterium]|nr:cyclic nucleotide-binding domain-containing protein [Magnetococcales bacterium]
MSEINSVAIFLNNVNHLGLVRLTTFKEIFPKIPNTATIQSFDFPTLCGESIAYVKMQMAGGKKPSRSGLDLHSTNRTPLNCLYPLVVSENAQNATCFTIGSDPDNRLVIPDFTVARHHATITRRGKNYYLKDLNSDFGSYINNLSFGDEETLLIDGDQVAFGRYQFLFMEPYTLFEYIHQMKKKPPSVRARGIMKEEGEQLKIQVQQNYTQVSECVSKRKFENISEKLLSIISFIPFFNPFTIYERHQLIANPDRLINAGAGEIIIKENDASNSFYIVLKGKVEVVKQGRTHQLSVFGPGNCFGEIAFLTGTPRSADVIAMEQTILFAIDHNLYENIGIEIREKIKDQIIRQVSSNIIRQNRNLTDMSLSEQSAPSEIYRKKGVHAELDKDKAKQIIEKFVSENQVFAQFSQFQKNGLVSFLDVVRSYKHGEIIVEENTLNDSVNFVVDGSAYVTVTEKDVVLSEITAGDMFGEVSAFGKKKVSANIIAKNNVMVVSISGENMRTLPVEIREKMKDIALEQILRRIKKQNIKIIRASV